MKKYVRYEMDSDTQTITMQIDDGTQTAEVAFVGNECELIREPMCKLADIFNCVRLARRFAGGDK